MKVTLNPILLTDESTISEMWIDGKYQCDTLEDRVRPNNEKVYGKTAIPAGIYKIVLSYSPKFKRILPEILNVPMFSGIRIHAGNTAKDTEGCLLVGIWNPTVANFIGTSRNTLAKVMNKFKKAVDAGEEITIEIKRDYAV